MAIRWSRSSGSIQQAHLQSDTIVITQFGSDLQIVSYFVGKSEPALHGVYTLAQTACAFDLAARLFLLGFHHETLG